MNEITRNGTVSQRILGTLAMRFRSTRDETARAAIATEYARAVEQLIAAGNWQETPAFEDQLPDDCMPLSFFRYWNLPVPNERNGHNGGGR